MCEEVKARFVTVNCCAFVSPMIIIKEGNLWLVATTATKCLFAYEEKSLVVNIDVPPFL